MSTVIEKVQETATPIIAEEGCEWVHAELVSEEGRRILRLYIDKEGGVTMADCVRVSHAVEDVLEVENCVPGAYHLEVSSPGLNRPLVTIEHFSRVLEQQVVVATREKIAGRAHYKGVLKEVREGHLVIHIDNKDFIVPMEKISKANLA
jgi:ribosome maturation factor RimP